MLVGEQPGDKEDLLGRPFVGPAGMLLRKAMAEAGLQAETTYITNAVKHFKFTLRGKRRMHQKPAPPEIAACVPWLQQELKFVAPELVVLLGATAVQAVLGKAGTIKSLRGRVIPRAPHPSVLVTVHPSFLLRVPDHEARAREYAAFVKDLALAAAYRRRKAG
jgi:DNA polymerase